MLSTDNTPHDSSHTFINVFKPERPIDGVWAPERRVVPFPNLIRIDFEHPFYVVNDIASLHGIIDYTGHDSDGLPIGIPVSSILKPKTFNEYLSSIYQDSTASLTDKQKEFIASILYYRKFFIKPPVAFKDAVYFNPSGNAIDKLIRSNSDQVWNPFPEAFRFYAAPIGDTASTVVYNMKFKLNIPLYEIAMPFYFAKATITNKEYREFTNWVRDSLLHLALSDIDKNHLLHIENDIDPPLINWKEKIDLSTQDAKEAIADLYLPETERFYKRKEIDVRKLNFCYYTPPQTKPDDSLRHIIIRFPDKHVVNIYPDTLKWWDDFNYETYELLTNMYFWHPAYDDYPVVGISREQAIAYLNWKTDQEQKKLNKEGKGDWVISFELPTEYEWEMVESADQKNEQPDIYPDYFTRMSDYSYITDLVLTNSANDVQVSFNDRRDTVIKKRESSPNIRRLVYPKANFSNCPNYQNLFDNPKDKKHTGMREPTLKSDFEKNDKYVKQNPFVACNYDCNGISFMGGNVSEWMHESYGHNWKKVYDFQHKFLEHLNGKDAKLVLAMEDYSKGANDTIIAYGWDLDTSISYLVRGANWWDRRTGSINNKNIAGMNAKVFINQDSTHATVGFRYVIKLHRRDERKIIDSIKSTIHFKPMAMKKN